MRVWKIHLETRNTALRTSTRPLITVRGAIRSERRLNQWNSRRTCKFYSHALPALISRGGDFRARRKLPLRSAAGIGSLLWPRRWAFITRVLLKFEFAEAAAVAAFDTCRGEMKRFPVYSHVCVPWFASTAALMPFYLFMALVKNCHSPLLMSPLKKKFSTPSSLYTVYIHCKCVYLVFRFKYRFQVVWSCRLHPVHLVHSLNY